MAKEISRHRFPYRWTLAEAGFTKDKGKVFSCFSCGGGSTMGYKLAGFDVVGCCEIDPRMMAVYEANHHPRHPFLMPIQEFKGLEELPEELYGLDILDGSPPCSTFSMAGSREAAWGKKKKFREGQAEQVLDTLFFDFIDLARRLRPKVVVAENVKGLLLGEAKGYVRRIEAALDEAGYYVNRYLLNSQDMGVPQKRERVFFCCLRKDLAEPVLERASIFEEKPRLDLSFSEPGIPFGEVMTDDCDRPLSDHYRRIWENRQPGDKDLSQAWARMGNNHNAQFNYKLLYAHRVANTLTAADMCVLYDQPRHRSRSETLSCSSWPTDYDFGREKPEYVCGMSVPPVMMAQIAARIHEQWLSRI